MLFPLLMLVLKRCCCRDLFRYAVWEAIVSRAPFCRTGLVEGWKVVLVEVAQGSAAAQVRAHACRACLGRIARQRVVETTESWSAALLSLAALLACAECWEVAEVEFAALPLTLRLPTGLP